MDDSSGHRRILQGSLEDLPVPPSSTVRVFLSSTFSDYYIERNELMRSVFPELRDHCLSRGLDFQVVDMRWGVSEIAGDDHKASALCVDQIRTCQEISAGSNFVVFLGQRYGYRPIPAEIQTCEFMVLLGMLTESTDNDNGLQLIRQWYKEDTNAIPPIYRLQEISSIIRDYRCNDAKAKKAANKLWWAAHDKMQATLRHAARRAYEKELITWERKHVYFRSVTEEEVHHGILSPDFTVSRSAKIDEKVLCFRREFNGVEQAVRSDPLAKKYFEKVDGQVDTEGMDLLNDLKNHQVAKVLPGHRIHDYPKLDWTPKGVDPQVDGHRAYLSAFCDDVKRSLKEQIEIESEKKRQWTESMDTDADLEYLVDELLFNAAFCAKTCKKFKGREDVIGEIKEKLLGGSLEPLIIHGPSGVGRTSVVAKVVELLPSWLGADVIRVARFLRSMPGSTLLYDVIWSVLEQMKACGILEPLNTHEEEDVYKDSTSIANYFGNCCIGIGVTVDSPVVIVLDTVDGLKTQGGAHFMSWLPTALASNIKIILSVVSGEENCLCYNTLREKFNDGSSFVTVGPLDSKSALQIFTSLLASKQRTLTEEQFSLVSDTLTTASLVNPLLLSLLVKEAQQWRSYQPASTKSLEFVVEAAIERLFDQTEYRHGVILTSHSLGYVTAAKQGLSDLEMEDLLSVDNEVLMEVYWIQKPPDDRILRIPGSLWQRIQYDLRAYLTTRFVDGRPLVWWAYRQFIDVANKRYYHESYSEKYKLDANAVHTHLGNYFGDMLSHPNNIQPVTLTIRGEEITYEDTDRQIPIQPLKYSATRYNTRRLEEFPYHLIKARRYDILYDEVFLMPYWLRTKIEAEGHHETLYDFKMYLEQEENAGIRAIFHAMHKMSFAHPEEFEADLCARLADYSSVYPETVGVLIARAKYDCEKSEAPGLVPLTAYAGESGHLHHTIPRNEEDMFTVLGDRSELLLITPDWDVTVFHLIKGDSLRQAKLGFLRTNSTLYMNILLSKDKANVYIVAQSWDDAEHSVCCHVIDIINLKHKVTYSKFIPGYAVQGDRATPLGVSPSVILVRQLRNATESTLALDVPSLEVIAEFETMKLLTDFVAIESQHKHVIFKRNSSARSDHVIIYSSLSTAGNRTVLEISTNNEQATKLLCTPVGIIHGQSIEYKTQLEDGAGASVITMYDYTTGQVLQQVELQYTPTSITHTGDLLLVHFPWSIAVYNIESFQQLFVIKDSQQVIHETSSLGQLFLMNARDMCKVYDLHTGALVEEWYPGCSRLDVDQVQFCKNPNTGSLYLLQSFSGLYQSLIKMWRPQATADHEKKLPPITEKFSISQSGRLAVGLRKDSKMYKMDLESGENAHLGTFHDVVALSIASDASMVAVVMGLNLEAQLCIFDVKTNMIKKTFTCPTGKPTFHMKGIGSKWKSIQCLGFARDNSIIVLRVPTTDQEAKLYLVNTEADGSEMIRIVHYNGANQIYQCKLYGDVLFYGFYGGPAKNRDSSHGSFVRHNLHTDQRELFSVPSSRVTLDGERLYMWRGSPSDYVLLAGPNQYIESNTDRRMLANLKQLAHEDPEEDVGQTRPEDADADTFTYQSSSTCYAFYTKSEWVEIDLKAPLRKVFCHEKAFVAIMNGEGLVHVDIAGRTPTVTYIAAEVVGGILLMSTVKGGDVSIVFDGSTGSLALMDLRAGRLICRYHLQGDTIAFANPAHLHALPDLQKVVFASDGAADAAIFTANDALNKVLDNISANSGENACEANLLDSEECFPASDKEVVLVAAKLCSLM